MKKRIFWRHAEAGFAARDLDRSLTERGRRQAEQTAAWLKSRGADALPLYTSEAVRTRETAAYLGKPAAALAGLNPDGSYGQAAQTLAAIADDAAVIVGHLPWIGEAAGELLGTGFVPFNTAQAIWLESADNINWRIAAQFG